MADLFRLIYCTSVAFTGCKNKIINIALIVGVFIAICINAKIIILSISGLGANESKMAVSWLENNVPLLIVPVILCSPGCLNAIYNHRLFKRNE